MERRLTFSPADLDYLANLCHNCGECLYACQYAPPHEFAINVPKMLADVRVASYEAYCWPAGLASTFRRQGAAVALGLAAGFTAVLMAALATFNPGAGRRVGTSAAFYAVMPHGVMVALFGGVALFVVVAIGIGVRRFWKQIVDGPVDIAGAAVVRALRDALTLAHLHPQGADCVQAEEARRPWRRWLHHATFYGFGLCTLSTSVAAVYHGVFGWEAPYAYTSMPVVLGSLGGVGLVVGPAGLLLLRRGRDPMLSNAPQTGLDVAFLTLLLATSVTGLALLGLRHSVGHAGAARRAPRMRAGALRDASLWEVRPRLLSHGGARRERRGERGRGTLSPAMDEPPALAVDCAPHQRRAAGGARLDASDPAADRAPAHRRRRPRAQPLQGVPVGGGRTASLHHPGDARAHLWSRRRGAQIAGGDSRHPSARARELEDGRRPVRRGRSVLGRGPGPRALGYT
jgi:citrate/tricarballylate utilization protein